MAESGKTLTEINESLRAGRIELKLPPEAIRVEKGKGIEAEGCLICE